jgi:hypothetical protein
MDDNIIFRESVQLALTLQRGLDFSRHLDQQAFRLVRLTIWRIVIEATGVIRT